MKLFCSQALHPQRVGPSPFRKVREREFHSISKVPRAWFWSLASNYHPQGPPAHRARCDHRRVITEWVFLLHNVFPSVGAFFADITANLAFRAEKERSGVPVSESSLSVGDTAPKPLPSRSEAEIVASWTSASPVVTVLCPTYSHADFIEDAILGFLGQETTFPFEVIIRDDSSTDNTAEITREYQTKYPQIIRCIYGAENQYRNERARSSMSRVARGEFLAYCEGDDYWISPIKLETQINSLRERTDCVVSHHQAVVVEDGQVVSIEKLPE